MICPKCGDLENYTSRDTSKTHGPNTRKHTCLSCGETWSSVQVSIPGLISMVVSGVVDAFHELDKIK